MPEARFCAFKKNMSSWSHWNLPLREFFSGKPNWLSLSTNTGQRMLLWIKHMLYCVATCRDASRTILERAKAPTSVIRDWVDLNCAQNESQVLQLSARKSYSCDDDTFCFALWIFKRFALFEQWFIREKCLFSKRFCSEFYVWHILTFWERILTYCFYFMVTWW